MSKKSPEDIAALKAKYAVDNSAKEKAKADKKAKFAAINAEQNMPVCEIRIPWEWDMGRHYPEKVVPDGWTVRDGRMWKHVSNEDLELPRWQNYIEGLERIWRIGPCFTKYGVDWSQQYTGPCKRKIIRTTSLI